MTDPSISPEYVRVERDMHVSGLRYEFGPPNADLLPRGAPIDVAQSRGLWLSIPGAGIVGIGFDDGGDEEERTHRVADQVQVAVLDSGQVATLRTWPRAERGGSPLWARLRDGLAVWESTDGTELHRIGELPAGR
ncbi:hypothetical protein [Tsukamurella paurometabola]|uniref:Uncharacterized protein n=1 Tax=Tsukamurella paurometabola (strain ATCC 8368 / DSM 20162 / CCUG 35730 / CIP 100753 / JCM 10117 / KCTC 9821 / NBRC 16120 / NCIMB 702349 / NCTC 13040) TaxID=521096 RepID=D5UT88_TSUPD|nr:hypothetical protein [Tsukamurella paurometabola]ADG79373.1 hypothetical protein Tpau_2775 [Tsukamurella paurometabola DSM 20162]SUP35303.1 Uncharacterised protein [Tsukamurella paurometabola]